MKILFWIPVLTISLLFVSCKPKATVTKKMDAGAEKIAEGVKEMSKTVAEETQHAANTATGNVVEAAADAGKEAEKIRNEAATAVEEVVDTPNEEVEETKPDE